MSYKQKSNGFGLIEMMVSVFILSLVVAVAAVFFGYYIKNYNFSFQQGQVIADADFLFARINEEVREMRVSEDGGYPLVVANDNEIGFYSNVDNDDSVEKVRYFLSGTEIIRGVTEPSESIPIYDSMNETVSVVASDIRNTTPIFYYYNQNWPGDNENNPLAQADRLIETRLVKVELVININPTENEDFKIDTEIMMRNLKTN